jgi:hypothetical protein
MIRHKLPNKTKSATVVKPKLFHQLNKPSIHVIPLPSNTRGMHPNEPLNKLVDVKGNENDGCARFELDQKQRVHSPLQHRKL